MTKRTGKPQGSRVVRKHLPPVTRDKRMKTSSQLRPPKNVKVARASARVNNHLRAKLTKKTSQKPPTTRNLRKNGGSKLCSQCCKVNEELNQNGPEEVPESVEIPVIPAGPVGSQ
ncbi:uncharacterized protein LOC113887461 [Bos indicus x Bos taurus]|uniref:uncharacterized protein n=1 Tax=Bos taurus TaxID=9913 RepID=UPI0000EBE885|nr:PREDICTED: uncharacterized protein LOC109554999 [Bos indicus]XP_024845010.1 uncharacterized protein LOC112445774 [Bos taurus]XP_024845122.1 uncharacterized protein LOC112445847 [Bos taurus]XP_024845123.1 uncharacterized protein LOC112445848 [Bos taurus]XP_024845124.1 uncharacterized protein LOC112445849 [Bos taurus]XP_024845125.1 uncharacterized protein LOC112445850 [Bos taurus]XP_027390383.1 uncharacterized protein LOC113887443 [Bos indicus x Bos taurus]XP_027390384.1 uncharacterized pro